MNVQAAAHYPRFHVSLASAVPVAAYYSCKGGGSIPLSRGCFKANFTATSPPPALDGFVSVFVPFSSFSDLWVPKTGEQKTSCQADSSACLTAAHLADVQRVEIWAEGTTGKVSLSVKSIDAVSEAPAAAPPPPGVDR